MGNNEDAASGSPENSSRRPQVSVKKLDPLSSVIGAMVGILATILGAMFVFGERFGEMKGLPEQIELLRDRVQQLDSAFESAARDRGMLEARAQSADRRVSVIEGQLSGTDIVDRLVVGRLEVADERGTRVELGRVGASAHHEGYGLIIHNEQGDPGLMLCSGQAKGEHPAPLSSSLTLFDPERGHPAYWIRTSLPDDFDCVVREEMKDSGRQVRVRRSLQANMQADGVQRGPFPYVSFFDSKQQVIMQFPHIDPPKDRGLPNLIGLLLKQADQERLRIYCPDGAAAGGIAVGEPVIDLGSDLQRASARKRITTLSDD